MKAHLLYHASKGALPVFADPAGRVSSEGADAHLVDDQVLGGDVGPRVGGAPVEGRLLEVECPSEGAAPLFRAAHTQQR